VNAIIPLLYIGHHYTVAGLIANNDMLLKSFIADMLP